MTKSKKYFLIGAIIFVIIMALLVFDFAQKTKFPGQNKAIEHKE